MLCELVCGSCYAECMLQLQRIVHSTWTTDVLKATHDHADKSETNTLYIMGMRRASTCAKIVLKKLQT